MDAVLKLLRRTCAAALAAMTVVAVAPQSRAQGAQVEAGDVTFEALPAQRLAPGRCGLFLWAQRDDPVFILSAIDQPAQAMVRSGGRDRRLERTEATGNATFGLFEHQTFSDGRLTLEVDIHIDENREIRSGAIVDRGFIRMRNAEGWETIIPTGGMIACGA